MRSVNLALAAPMRDRRPVKPSADPSCCHVPGDSAEDSRADATGKGFASERAAALALLNGDCRAVRLTRKAGSFLGQLCVDPTPMSVAQRDWLETLLERAGLPPLRESSDA